MERYERLLIVGIVLSLSVSATLWAEKPAPGSSKESVEPEIIKPSESSKLLLDLKAKSKANAMARYKRILECYKSGTLSEIKNEIKKITPMKLLLPRSAQADLAYIPKTLAGYRPPWWSNMKSPSNVTFKAVLWGRAFTANYVPSDMLGSMQTVDVRNGKLVTIVSWRPHMIDNPKPAGGYLAKRYNLAK